MSKTYSQKIVLFDSWTKGRIHLHRVNEALASQGTKLIIAHLGSWGDEKDAPIEAELDGILCRDVAYYQSPRKIIEIEKPDAVLFLSLDPLAHRAFNILCQDTNTPTINMYHGVHSVFLSLAPMKEGLTTKLFRVSTRFTLKNIRTMLFYVSVSLTSKGRFQNVLAFCRHILAAALCRFVATASSDASTDAICVFNAHDKRHAMKKYGATERSIHVIGNMDLVKFSMVEACLAGEGKNAVPSKSRKHNSIVYIGTGMRGTRYIFASNDEYTEHLLTIKSELASFGYDVKFRLHYSRLPGVKEALLQRKKALDFCDNDDFVPSISRSSGVIVEPSTAALLGIIFKKPIFLCKMGPLESLEFGPALADFPLATDLVSIGSLPAIIDDMNRGSRLRDHEVDEFVKSVSGPLPISGYTDRLVAAFHSVFR